ncbi:MAG: hypothetical protein ACRD8O_18505, partial [Bryobacteraceae bacterium]
MLDVEQDGAVFIADNPYVTGNDELGSDGGHTLLPLDDIRHQALSNGFDLMLTKTSIRQYFSQCKKKRVSKVDKKVSKVDTRFVGHSSWLR